MNKTHWFLRQCVFLVFMIQLVPWHEAFPQSTGQAGLIEGAKKEGKVVWYAAMNINDSNALLARFEKKYPFIKTELLRAGAEQLLNRILTEDSAGRSGYTLHARRDAQERAVPGRTALPLDAAPLGPAALN